MEILRKESWKLLIDFMFKICYSIWIMKSIILETVGFLLMCVCGTIFGGLLFMLYNVITSYVIGSQMNYFLPNIFLDGMLICFPPLLFFIPMLRLLSLVHHKTKKNIFALATICVLSLAFWIFLVPICEKAAHAGDALFEKPPSELTEGYFRKLDSDTYYLSSVKNKYIDALKFENDDSQKNQAERKVELVKDRRMVFERDKYGFSDPLVGERLQPSKIFAAIFQGLYSMEKSAFSACASGLKNWLFFSSIMVALLSVGALINSSSWRLVSAFWILFTTITIIALNFLYMNFYFAPLTRQLDSMGSFFIMIKNNFQFIMNCVISAVLIIAGTLCKIFVKNNFRGDDL